MQGKEKEKVFRRSFGRLSELRSLLPEGTNVLALTATASKETLQKVIRSLCMKNVLSVIRAPKRDNIKLMVQKVNTDIQSALANLANEHKEKGIAMPRTIVYCRSIRDCGILFKHFNKVLGDRGYIDGDDKSYQTRYFAMYHHCTVDTIKEHVLSSLLDPSGTVRIVMATNALGMGVNIQNIRTVVHWGPSRDIESYVQEIGRAGRDQLPACAVLLYTSRHLGLAYMTTQHCLRQELLQHFPGGSSTHSPKHTCCENCRRDCKCGMDGCQQSDEFLLWQTTLTNNDPQSTAPSLMRSVSAMDFECLKECLHELQTKYSSTRTKTFCGPDLTHGLTDKLITMVMEEAKYIFSAQYIIEKLPVMSAAVACDIAIAVSEVFEDFTFENNVAALHQEYQDILDHAYGYDFDSGSDTDDTASD